MSESKTNLIEHELRRKVRKRLENQVSEAVQVLMKGLPGFRFENVRFDLNESPYFTVFNKKREKLNYGELQFGLMSDNQRIEKFLFAILSHCFETRLLDQEVQELIRKATLLDD